LKIRVLKAFTLIELIIVIIIISMMSFLVFSENMQENKREKEISPLNLKEEILKVVGENREVTLFCINSCRRCYLLNDDRSISEFKGKLHFGKDFEAMVLNNNNEAISIDDFGRVKDQKVCFRFKIYKNGSSTKYILTNSEGVYFLPSFFGVPQEVDDVDTARKLWLREEFNLKDNANYY